MNRTKIVILIFLITGLLSGSEAKEVPLPEAILPFELSNDHIIIQLAIEDSKPLNFMFDSGAGGTLILKEVADSIGLKASFSRNNIGVSGAHEVGVIRGVQIMLAGEKFQTTLLSTDSYLEEMDDGRKVHGIIGYPILSRYVVEINYEKSEIYLYNKFSYEYKGSGQYVPIEITSNLPRTKASVIMYNGVAFEGDFLIDTGARADVIIASKTVIEYGMSENIGKYYTVRARIGSSQRKTKMRYGRLHSISLGGYKFENIPVALSSDNKGVLALPNLNGIIGNRLLQRFNVVFDYQRGYIYFAPSILIGKEYVINYSGFNLYFVGGKPFMKNIIDRSPADKGGLRDGDELVAIDGELVENMAPEDIRDSFCGKEERVEIVIRRNKKLKYTELVLQALI